MHITHTFFEIQLSLKESFLKTTYFPMINCLNSLCSAFCLGAAQYVTFALLSTDQSQLSFGPMFKRDLTQQGGARVSERAVLTVLSLGTCQLV